MPAATPALRDSVSLRIGMPATTSHDERTSRPRPLPSDPTTSTTGPVARCRFDTLVVPPAANPTTKQPASRSSPRARTRLVTRATGTLAAAPADTFHAAAVTPAARRSGITTPCAPKAPADRSTAPRFRGSVTPSSAPTRAGTGEPALVVALDGVTDPRNLGAGDDVRDLDVAVRRD